MATNRTSRASQRPYRPRREPGRSEELVRLEDAVIAVSGSKDLDVRTKATLLDPLLNDWTTIDGRYGTRYRSMLVLGDDEYEIEQDHVWTRRTLKRVLLGDMNESLLRGVLRRLAVGCVVTGVEHDLLNAIDQDSDTEHLTGWERYEEAGVIVVDMAMLTVKTGPMVGRPFDWATRSTVPPSLDEILEGAWPSEV